MRLRVIAFIVAALFVLASVAVARMGGKAARPNGACAPVKIAKVLGLTPDQTQQIRGIVKQYRTDARAVLKSDIPKEEKRGRMDAMKQSAGTAIMALLSADQQEKAKRLNLIERLLSPRKSKAMGIRRALAQLNLSDDQNTQIKAIFEDSKATAKRIKDDPNLDPAGKKAQLKALHQETNSRVMSVLTLEQQEKLKQILANRKNAGRFGQRNRPAP